MNKYTATELTIPGYYWWLPEYLKNEPNTKCNWSIVAWHPLDATRQNSGLFIGPLKEPITE